jgi:hypothetical protein
MPYFSLEVNYSLLEEMLKTVTKLKQKDKYVEHMDCSWSRINEYEDKYNYESTMDNFKLVGFFPSYEAALIKSVNIMSRRKADMEREMRKERV